MNRSNILTALFLTASLFATVQPMVVEGSSPAIPNGARRLNIAPFNSAIAGISTARIVELDGTLVQAAIPQLQKMFESGKLTSEELVTYYLWRIKRYDLDKLNSIAELNPDALEIARTLDAERKAGRVRGPLHGTVAVLKDNIGTGDKLHTTAGAIALMNAKSDRDAFVVKQLRDAGVVILGKAAMTEWARWLSDDMPEGWSALSGLVKNPYGSKYLVFGSSTGPAVAVSANLATFSIGTETWGSLTAPALVNSAFTLKPTLGIVSRDRIIPITDAQDTAGPLTRNATDLALVMHVIAGQDRNDYPTLIAKGVPSGFAQALHTDRLHGMRIGILPPAAEDELLHQSVIAGLKAAGATVVALPALPDIGGDIFGPFAEIGGYGFKTGVNAYLQAIAAPIKSVAELVAFNAQDPAKRVPYGQAYLENSANSTLTDLEYAATVLAIRSKAQTQINGLLDDNKLDMLAAMNETLLTRINYPGAGYPALSMPAGIRADGQPMGVIFVGPAMGDVKLMRVAFALEQASAARQPPDLKRWK